MMKIVFLDADTVGETSSLSQFNNLGAFTVFPHTLPEETAGRIKDCNVVITNKVRIDRQVIDQAPRLKLICVAATGTNTIDKAYAQQKGIAVKNVEDYSTHSVAQHTFALLLALLNQVRYYDDYVRKGAYGRQPLFTHLGPPVREINGKRFAVIGLGSIGRQAAAIAEAFGAGVVYYSSSGKDRHDRYQRLDLDELLTTADIVSIHAPLHEKTENLITYRHLSTMKKSAMLINTGRGGIVNEGDLARALDEDLIAGAGIDVFTEEPIGAEHPYMTLAKKEKLILTPHIAWTSQEARDRLMQQVYRHIEEEVGRPKTGDRS